MPKIQYREVRITGATAATIETADAIISEYKAQGYELTLRQLYYQFVARGLIPNNDREYKKLGEAINTGRLIGELDWLSIVDRTRYLRKNPHWSKPSDILQSCGYSFAIDKWLDQENHVEVWVEKDALVGIVEMACQPLDVPFISCRGYFSQSEMWAAAQRLRGIWRSGKRHVVVIHLGDHDPSGIDMTRDIRERLHEFGDSRIDVRRIALNMDQVQLYNPPPNPAKLTDARCAGYVEKYGNESWELDALEPSIIKKLIQDEILGLREDDVWEMSVQREENMKETLWDIYRGQKAKEEEE